MELLDPRLAVITGVGAAVLGSHRVRSVVGHGLGYVAVGAKKVADPFIGAATDIAEEARDITSHNGHATHEAPATRRRKEATPA